MDRIERIAERLVAQVDTGGLDPLAVRVADFLSASPNPSDDDFHEWAEGEGVDKHEAEAAAYRLATCFAEFLLGGKANEEGVTENDVDPDELSMGINVEKEHTPNVAVAKRIALDHLAEIDDYYTRLAEMEEEAGVEH